MGSDTSTFSILREEFDFGDRVPLPMLVRSIGPYVRGRYTHSEVDAYSETDLNNTGLAMNVGK